MKYEIKLFAVSGKKKEWLATYTRHKRMTTAKIVSNLLKSHRGSGDYDILIEQRETKED